MVYFQYENISEWNVMNDKSQTKYEKDIDKFILGFVQLWDNFESTLSGELVKTHQSLNGDESHGTGNYELFYRVGSRISHGENLTMGELSNVLSVPLSTATRIVDYLVESGYIRRLPDPEDRRVVRVGLTTAGLKLYGTIDNHVKERAQQLLACLDNEEREHLYNILGKVLSANQGEST
jgi:DNA-binding MarR family transcriptional regulator